MPRKNGALVRAKFCETQINIHGERLERAALFLFGGDWQKEGGQKKGGREWERSVECLVTLILGEIYEGVEFDVEVRPDVLEAAVGRGEGV